MEKVVERRERRQSHGNQRAPSPRPSSIASSCHNSPAWSSQSSSQSSSYESWHGIQNQLVPPNEVPPQAVPIILLLVLINRPQIWIIFIQRSFTTILYHPGVHRLPILVGVHLPLPFTLLKDVSFLSSPLLFFLSISMRSPLFYPYCHDTMKSYSTLCSRSFSDTM